MEAARKRMSTEARREQLLAFGRKHFAEHGYDAMPMDAIAERAGVSKGLLYHYFGNQRGFYLETVRGITDEVIAVTEPPANLPFDAAFRSMLEEFVGYIADHSAIYTALVRGGLGSDDELNTLLDRVRVVSVTRVLDRLGVDTPSPLGRLAVYGWVSFVENVTAEWTSTSEVSPEELVDLLLDAFAPVHAVLQRQRC